VRKQFIFAGRLQGKFQQELQNILIGRLVERLWSRDASLWPKELIDRDSALAKMEWLALPEAMEQFLELVRGLVQGADAEGLVDHALLTSESVNLCARAFLGLPGIPFARKILVFDSISPEAIQENEAGMDLSRTLFVLANKEHYELKDHCLFLYFREKLQAIEGACASRHFVSQAESRSYLAGLSREYTFRDFVHDPPAIPSAYCSLRQFGAVLIAIHAADPERMQNAINQVRGACSAITPPDSNPALQMAAFLSSVIADHCGYLAFLASPSLMAYPHRLGQLFGASLARESRGLIPLTEIDPRDASAIESDTAFVLLSYAGDPDEEIDKASTGFRANQTPFLHVEMAQPLDLLTETYQWEIATILACARLGTDPFDVADNRVPRAFSDEILEQLSRGENALQRSPRLTDGRIQLFAGKATRQEISMLSLSEALRTFLRIATPGRHVSLLVNLGGTREVRAKFHALRSKLTIALQRPVVMVFGPHAPEHTGYFFRDSLPYGPCIVGAHYRFGQFYQALALSEYDTIEHQQHPVIRLHLARDFPEALDQLLHVFEQALHRFPS